VEGAAVGENRSHCIGEDSKNSPCKILTFNTTSVLKRSKKQTQQPQQAIMLEKYYEIGCGGWDQQPEIRLLTTDLSC